MTRVRQFSEEAFTGSPGLKRAWEMTDRLEIYLSGCQLGITVSSVGLGVVAEPALAALFGPLLDAVGLGTGGAGHGVLSVLLALGVMNLAHVVIGEQAPTYLGIERSRTVCRYCALILYYWTKLMGPVILLADWVAKRLLGLVGVTIERSWAEEELGGEEEPSDRAAVRRQMGDRLAGLGLSEDRREEVMAALDIDRVPVGDVMIPCEDVVALRVDEPFKRARERAAQNPHTRFPLVGESLKDFRGVVYVPAVLRELDALAAGKTTLSEGAADPLTLPAGTAVSEAIDRFQDAGAELALVTAGSPDDVGEVVGLVTATDLLEVISGEIEDPLDEETPAAGTR